VTVTAWAGCIPSSSAIPATAVGGRDRSCAAPSCASRSSASPPGPARPRCCGCGGPAPAAAISIGPGAPTFAGSTWSTPSASPSRPWAGPPRGHAILTRPTAGPGWCWPPTPSCAWPARPLVTSGCRGSGPDPAATVTLPSPPRVSAAAVHARVAGHHAETLWALPRPAQGPYLRACRPLPDDQEANQEAPHQADQGHESRLSDHSRHHPAADKVSGQSSMPAGLNHKLRD
jgi:hypothetical protein